MAGVDGAGTGPRASFSGVAWAAVHGFGIGVGGCLLLVLDLLLFAGVGGEALILTLFGPGVLLSILADRVSIPGAVLFPFGPPLFAIYGVFLAVARGRIRRPLAWVLAFHAGSTALAFWILYRAR